ncbi:SNARE 11 family protein [Cinnamomum micranthum f. kanehirae]|uniref:SNARE 11 family protein n=1 Tax=Cinnamomum micranthum f. kanehirae TaxID=337451 RepID=A0A443P7K9_9MAGN|nr:SNARE 11 family protein [Cinnamomum micranthum f. kanehirae]
MGSLAEISPELDKLDGQISDIFRALSNGFQKLEKIKDSNRQSRQLEELTGKMRDCKRLIKEFEREVKEKEGRYMPDANKMITEKKQSMVMLKPYKFKTLYFIAPYCSAITERLLSIELLIVVLQIKELNSYVALKKQYASTLETKRADVFDGPGSEENVLLASSMSNQQLIDHGNQMMDETDQSIERSKKVVQDTINVGTETAASLKAQTEQMSRIVNELDSIQFSIKKAAQLVKQLGRGVSLFPASISFFSLFGWLLDPWNLIFWWN